MGLSPRHLCGSCPRDIRSERYPRLNEVSFVVNEATHHVRGDERIEAYQRRERKGPDQNWKFGSLVARNGEALVHDHPQSPRPRSLLINHPALTTLSTARAPTPSVSGTGDSSVELAFSSYHPRSSSPVLLQRAFAKPLREPILCWLTLGKIVMHQMCPQYPHSERDTQGFGGCRLLSVSEQQRGFISRRVAPIGRTWWSRRVVRLEVVVFIFADLRLSRSRPSVTLILAFIRRCVLVHSVLLLDDLLLDDLLHDALVVSGLALNSLVANTFIHIGLSVTAGRRGF